MFRTLNFWQRFLKFSHCTPGGSQSPAVVQMQRIRFPAVGQLGHECGLPGQRRVWRSATCSAKPITYHVSCDKWKPASRRWRNNSPVWRLVTGWWWCPRHSSSWGSGFSLLLDNCPSAGARVLIWFVISGIKPKILKAIVKKTYIYIHTWFKIVPQFIPRRFQNQVFWKDSPFFGQLLLSPINRLQQHCDFCWGILGDIRFHQQVPLQHLG